MRSTSLNNGIEWLSAVPWSTAPTAARKPPSLRSCDPAEASIRLPDYEHTRSGVSQRSGGGFWCYSPNTHNQFVEEYITVGVELGSLSDGNLNDNRGQQPDIEWIHVQGP